MDAMKKISRQIYQEKSLIGVEGNVATVDEIFRLQGAEELQAAEKKYLPSKKVPGDH
jgi:phosphoenolpyruvate phosphomutase